MEERLERKPNGIFQVVWYDPQTRHTRRHSFRTKDETQAKRRFALWLMEGEAEELGGISVDEILTKFDKERVENVIIDKDRERLNISWLRVHFGHMGATNITVEDVTDGYVKKRLNGEIGYTDDKGKAHGYRKAVNGTIRRELGTLVAAFSYAVKTRLFAKKDVPYIPLPEKSEPKERWLTNDECATLQLAAEWDGRARKHNPDRRCSRYVRITLATGARKASIQELMWSQVNFETGLITLHKKGKRRSKKRSPTVPIPNALRPYLEKWFEEKDSLYVLGSAGSIRKTFTTACKYAGLDDVTPHTLRHTWASHAAMNGVKLLDIAKVLGNSLAVVEETYAHLSPEYLRSAVNHKEQG